MISRQERTEAWLRDLPNGQFTTGWAYERFLSRWPNARVSMLSVAQSLTRAGYRSSGKGPGRTWMR